MNPEILELLEDVAFLSNRLILYADYKEAWLILANVLRNKAVAAARLAGSTTQWDEPTVSTLKGAGMGFLNTQEATSVRDTLRRAVEILNKRLGE